MGYVRFLSWTAWHGVHFLTFFSISRSIPGNQQKLRARDLVFDIPWWHLWQSQTTLLRSDSGITSLFPLQTIPSITLSSWAICLNGSNSGSLSIRPACSPKTNLCIVEHCFVASLISCVVTADSAFIACTTSASTTLLTELSLDRVLVLPVHST